MLRSYSSFTQPVLITLVACSTLLTPCQAQKTSVHSPNEVTSLFAEDVTRERMGSIADLNADIQPIGHIKSKHFVFTGTTANIYVPVGSYVELQPSTDIPGFTPTAITVIEDGVKTQTFGLDKNSGLPFLRVNPPEGNSNRKRVQVVLYDATARPQVIQQFTLRSRFPNMPLSFSTQVKGEQCNLLISDRTSLSDVYIRLNGVYLGHVADKAEHVCLNAQRLPPGQYTCEMMAQSSDGVLLPAVTQQFSIPARYTLTGVVPDQSVTVEQPADTAVLPIHVKHLAGLGIVTTRVYIGGDLVKEAAEEEFDVKLPLKNIPSGKNTIDVIGVGADGATYPVESVLINIQNEPWEQDTYPKPEYIELKEKLAEVQALDKLFQYWFDQYSHEPFSKVVGEYLIDSRTLLPTLWPNIHSMITQSYAPGRALEYKRKADKCLNDMAKARLEAARLYVKLHMKQQARAQYRLVIQEVGADTPLAVKAKADVQELITPH